METPVDAEAPFAPRRTSNSQLVPDQPPGLLAPPLPLPNTSVASSHHHTHCLVLVHGVVGGRELAHWPMSGSTQTFGEEAKAQRSSSLQQNDLRNRGWATE